MDDATASKIQGIAKALAVKWGRSEIAEDFAQYAIICQLRWPGQDIEHSLIGYLRQEYGSSRTGSGRARQMATARAIRLDSPVDDMDAGGTLRHELIGDPEPDPRDLEPARDFSYLFRGRKEGAGRPRQTDLAQIYGLRFEEQLSSRQIADILGVTEQAIFQSCRIIQNKILHEAGLDEVREKLEEDPGITQIEIDWIRL